MGGGCAADPALDALMAAILHLDLLEHSSPRAVLACVFDSINVRSRSYFYKVRVRCKCCVSSVEQF